MVRFLQEPICFDFFSHFYYDRPMKEQFPYAVEHLFSDQPEQLQETSFGVVLGLIQGTIPPWDANELLSRAETAVKMAHVTGTPLESGSTQVEPLRERLRETISHTDPRVITENRYLRTVFSRYNSPHQPPSASAFPHS